MCLIRLRSNAEATGQSFNVGGTIYSFHLISHQMGWCMHLAAIEHDARSRLRRVCPFRQLSRLKRTVAFCMILNQCYRNPSKGCGSEDHWLIGYLLSDAPIAFVTNRKEPVRAIGVQFRRPDPVISFGKQVDDSPASHGCKARIIALLLNMTSKEVQFNQEWDQTIGQYRVHPKKHAWFFGCTSQSNRR
jgi:hypothetical protein